MLKLPIISRKKYESETKILRQTIAHNHRLHDDAEDKLSKELDSLLPRLFKCVASNNREFKTFRLLVEFHDDFIREGFIHGNSQESIRYLATRLSRQIERELLTINFARFREEGTY